MIYFGFCILLLATSSSFSCTLLHVSSEDNAKEIVVGRTFEYHQVFPYSLWSQPKRKNYGALFIGVKEVDLVFDGMNSAGLTVSAHAFHQAKYQAPSYGYQHVHFTDFVPFVLESFANVEQVVKSLQNDLQIVGWGDGSVNGKKQQMMSELGLHWGIQDALGQSIVIEYLNGQLNFHNSTEIGVMTNDPDYLWHLRNLNQYAGVRNEHQTSQKTCTTKEIGKIPSWRSHGHNLLGVPGDVSPASRFVRTFLLKQLALTGKPPKSFKESFELVNQLLNAVAFPIGSVAPQVPTERGFDHPQWSVIKIPKLKQFYIRMYSLPNWRKIDLNYVNLDPEAKPVAGRLLGSEHIDSIDITESFLKQYVEKGEHKVDQEIGKFEFV